MTQPSSPPPALDVTDTGGSVRILKKIFIVQAGRGGAGKREIEREKKTNAGGLF